MGGILGRKRRGGIWDERGRIDDGRRGGWGIDWEGKRK
jgi:hypothetical protein